VIALRTWASLTAALRPESSSRTIPVDIALTGTLQ
jgi:hypothetical protein